MASQEGHEKVVRLLLQSGAQDLPNKVGILHNPQNWVRRCIKYRSACM